jgi:hypothetical protein
MLMKNYSEKTMSWSVGSARCSSQSCDCPGILVLIDVIVIKEVTSATSNDLC